jgi:hypothetical protein
VVLAQVVRDGVTREPAALPSNSDPVVAVVVDPAEASPVDQAVLVVPVVVAPVAEVALVAVVVAVPVVERRVRLVAAGKRASPVSPSARSAKNLK